jgi:ring-1,2-phenylacetyl-CoA epoxidase subunit PaaC
MTPILDANQLAPDLQIALRGFLVALADTKRALGLRYAEWCDRAPTLEAGVAAAAMAQDQLGQARVLYSLIQEFPGAPGDLDDETSPHNLNLAFLDQSFPNWATFVAANLLIGAGVTIVEEALTNSRFAPLRSRMPKMLDEERFHGIHAEGWFKHLQQVNGSHASAQAHAVEGILPEVLCWFGDAQHTRLAEERIIMAEPGELRELYLERVGPLLEASAAQDLVRFNEKAARWSYAGALPWGEFDPTTRRVGIVKCPFCGGADVELFSLFGSQLLTTEYYCRNCRTVFENVRG